MEKQQYLITYSYRNYDETFSEYKIFDSEKELFDKINDCKKCHGNYRSYKIEEITNSEDLIKNLERSKLKKRNFGITRKISEIINYFNFLGFDNLK